MSKHIGSATIISQTRAHNSGWFDYGETIQGFAGANSGYYYVTVLKFITPDFGESSTTNVSFSLWTSQGNQKNVTLRYAICTSDINKERYTNTYLAVSDTYQLASGIVTLSDIQPAGGSPTYKTIAVNTSRLMPSTTYYLFLWASTSKDSPGFVVFQGSAYHEKISVTYYDPYSLSISAEQGSKIMVNRTASGRGAVGSLGNGAKIYQEDLLKISFAADLNYKIVAQKVNDENFVSGNTYIVESDVVVTAKAQPLASAVGATDADIESTSTITITRYVSSYTHTLTYSFGNLSETIIEKTLDNSVAWTVPKSFYAQIPNSKSGECTITCETFSGNTSLGKTSCKMTARASEEKCKPTVHGTIIDTNESTVALTGDNTKLIRYLSSAVCTIVAGANNGATIDNMKIVDTTVTSESPTVTFTKVERSSFEFSATDSRGYTTRVVVEPELVPYVKLTLNPLLSRPSPTSGEVTISFNGNFYNGNIGAYKNTLVVRYRYREVSDAAYGSWINIDPSQYGIGLSTYNALGTILLNDVDGSTTGFDYRKSYAIQVHAYDGANGKILSSVSSVIVVQQGMPIFDWGEQDFNFNVPVKINEINIYDIFYPINSVFMSVANTIPEPLSSAGEWASIATGIDGVYGWKRTA